MNLAFKVALVAALVAPALCRADTGDEQLEETANTCVQAQEPLLCMQSYGYRCHQGRTPYRSIEAQSMGCNLDLGDGRYHFVQMLYDDGGWSVDVQHAYYPEIDEPRWPEEDPALALSNYVEQSMDGYSVHSSGGGGGAQGSERDWSSGTRRIDGRVAVRAVCGMTVGFEVDAAAKENHRTDCEHLLWRTVRGLSQTEASGPFSAPALSEFEWDEQLVPIVSGDTALVVTGSYMFDDVHTPCRWKNDCCSTESVIYLNSCRAPTEEELQVIQSCLTKAGSPRSGEFAGCLRSSAVKTGCEVQPDGSQLCY